MKRISFTKDARRDLKEIYDYIAADNTAAANKQIQRLQDRWRTLLDQPRIGRERDEIKLGYRSVSEGEYVIFYRILSENEVGIMHVIHAKRDLSKLTFVE